MSLQRNAERASVSGAQGMPKHRVSWTAKGREIFLQKKRPPSWLQHRSATRSTHRLRPSSSEPTQSLSGIPNLPFDISFEMFSNLAPQDLLTLSRTTEAFRQLLFDRRLATVWKAARQRTFPDAPQCPEDVSEPFSTRDMR
ncbi:hypothetical protein OH76DRAFT_1206587 [Lentinus brumalis]|uniref:F-box domain-containing protein n=1 Tax=Lentinus brumalis TaxID=2498619 RepID=A0A371CSV4_9APHY|nr:hypothetical protein OH76DRAFT_1206587 [Polyporus brumalis]